MGLEIDREAFEEADYARFGARLDESLAALEELLARPGFGVGPRTLGAELELNLVGAGGRPFLDNRRLLDELEDPHVTLEADRFNLELNSTPVPIMGRPFAALGAELERSLDTTRRAALAHGARVVAVGILPTLREADLADGALTDWHRYRALSAGLRRLRSDRFHVHIEGKDTLDVDADDITMEGANTSLQLHLRVAPGDFARTYNAAQIATGPALAVACNSPTFLGRRLWDETRIALFQQAVDDRAHGDEDDWHPMRVSFGHGWVRSGALELFAESVALHAPLLPVLGPEAPLDAVHAGKIPGLEELRLHHGTVWRWNRAVFDPAWGGHLRIEMRALPAGPTVLDMMAEGAFLLGLTLGLAPDADDLVSRMTFGQARRNFYEAARHGLDAELLWPSVERPSPRAWTVHALVLELLPVARHGLVAAGVDPAHAEELLSVVEARVAAGVSGAAWQRRAIDSIGTEAMFERYIALSAERRPVHTWPLP